MKAYLVVVFIILKYGIDESAAHSPARKQLHKKSKGEHRKLERHVATGEHGLNETFAKHKKNEVTGAVGHVSGKGKFERCVHARDPIVKRKSIPQQYDDGDDEGDDGDDEEGEDPEGPAKAAYNDYNRNDDDYNANAMYRSVAQAKSDQMNQMLKQHYLESAALQSQIGQVAGDDNNDAEPPPEATEMPYDRNTVSFHPRAMPQNRNPFTPVNVQLPRSQNAVRNAQVRDLNPDTSPMMSNNFDNRRYGNEESEADSDEEPPEEASKENQEFNAEREKPDAQSDVYTPGMDDQVAKWQDSLDPMVSKIYQESSMETNIKNTLASHHPEKKHKSEVETGSANVNLFPLQSNSKADVSDVSLAEDFSDATSQFINNKHDTRNSDDIYDEPRSHAYEQPKRKAHSRDTGLANYLYDNLMTEDQDIISRANGEPAKVDDSNQFHVSEYELSSASARHGIGKHNSGQNVGAHTGKHDSDQTIGGHTVKHDSDQTIEGRTGKHDSDQTIGGHTVKHDSDQTVEARKINLARVLDVITPDTATADLGVNESDDKTPETREGRTEKSTEPETPKQANKETSKTVDKQRKDSSKERTAEWRNGKEEWRNGSSKVESHNTTTSLPATDVNTNTTTNYTDQADTANKSAPKVKKEPNNKSFTIVGNKGDESVTVAITILKPGNASNSSSKSRLSALDNKVLGNVITSMIDRVSSADDIDSKNEGESSDNKTDTTVSKVNENVKEKVKEKEKVNEKEKDNSGQGNKDTAFDSPNHKSLGNETNSSVKNNENNNSDSLNKTQGPKDSSNSNGAKGVKRKHSKTASKIEENIFVDKLINRNLKRIEEILKKYHGYKEKYIDTTLADEVRDTERRRSVIPSSYRNTQKTLTEV